MSERLERSCPECAEPILAAALKCRYCGAWIESGNPTPEPNATPPKSPSTVGRERPAAFSPDSTSGQAGSIRGALGWLLLLVLAIVASGIGLGWFGSGVGSPNPASRWEGEFGSSAFTPADDGSTLQVTRSLRVSEDGIRYEETGTASARDGTVTMQIHCRSGPVDTEMARSAVPTKCFMSLTAWADSVQLPVGGWDWFKYNEASDTWESRTAEGAFVLARVTQDVGGEESDGVGVDVEDANLERHLVVSQKLIRVSADSRVTFVPLAVSPESSNIYGSAYPLVSPDGRWVAFTSNHDLWLYDTHASISRRVTVIGKPYDELYSSIDVLVAHWAPDSKGLLVSVQPGELECVDCEDRGDWIMRDAQYGYHFFDLNLGQLRLFDLPSDFSVSAWHVDGRILVLRGGWGELMTIRSGQSPQPFAGDGNFNQVSLVNGVGIGMRSLGDVSHVVRLDIESGAVTNLSSPAGWAIYQWPRLSPSGARFAWIRSTGEVASPSSVIEVEGAARLRCGTWTDFAWLDEQRVAYVCDGTIRIADASTGAELGRSEPVPERRQD